MSRTRFVAAMITGLLVSAPVGADAAPIPYSALVRQEGGSTAPRRPKLKPHTLRPKAAVPHPSVAGAQGAPSPSAAPLPGGASPFAPSAIAPQAGQLRPARAPDAPRPASPSLTPRAIDLPSAPTPIPTPTPQGARLPPGALLPGAEVEAFVDGLVREGGVARPLAGVAVSVVQGGQVVLEKGYGLARRAPATRVDPRVTVFRLGSVSKVFTWIEVLKAVEAGRLHLDDPVNAHLPRDLAIADDGFRAQVRLRDLMAHEAGFESREFGRLFRADAAAVRPLAETLRAERPRRVRAPGEMPTYSNYGAALAGFLAADSAHKPFDKLVEDGLLRPAGLTSTTFGEPGAAGEGLPASMSPVLADRLAQGFSWTRDGLAPEPFGFAAGLAPSLSASSTADDMGRLMLVLLANGRAGNGSQLWGSRTDAALRTPLTPGWAHGLMVYDLPGGFRGFGHDGATPAFRAKLVFVPQLNLGVFVAANSDTAERLVETLPELLVARFYASPSPMAPTATATGRSDDLRPFAGTYVSTRRTYHGLEGFVDRLTRLYTVRAEPGGALVVRGPEGGRRWFAVPDRTSDRARMVAADGTGAPLTFLFDGAARARAFLDPAGQWGAERVDGLHRPATLLTAGIVAELAALLTLAGLFVRDAREYRQSRRQETASRVQSLGALLWLAALGLFTAFAATATRDGLLQRLWPNPWLVAASACALGAGLLTLGQLALLPGAWSSERRVQGWGGWRKLRHTATTLAFAALTFVLLGWGALEPWSS